MSDARGVIAAGHPSTAEAGAEVLRSGGNAVDAAVAAVLASFVAESPLTGFGAGGFMLVHTGGDDVLLDFFVEAPGRGGQTPGELLPVSVIFDETPQVFNLGCAACGTPGTAAGLAEAARRFGTIPLSTLVEPAVSLARNGVTVTPEQDYLFTVLEPIVTVTPESTALYAPGGKVIGEGDVFRWPELADTLERFGRDGPAPFYEGEIGEAIVEWVSERGGTIGMDDLEAYEVVDRRPIRAAFRGREVLTNAPPSSGGILIAFCLALLDRVGTRGTEAVVAAMDEANLARGEPFHSGLYEEGYAERFLSESALSAAAARVVARLHAPARTGEPPGPQSPLGSTTHIAVIDGAGMCASVTCSNGSGSGVIVPGTGVHMNNMLGEEDLNPLGFHFTPPGARITSMMAPTIVLRDGAVELALGSAGSNRLRSAILLTILRMIDDGLGVEAAVEAGRVHFEADTVQAEPGVDEDGLRALEAHGYKVARWRRKNLFFGGVQAVSRDPETGALGGAGDPRRGGAAVVT